MKVQCFFLTQEKFIGEIKDDEANSTKGVESRREEAPAYATEIMQRMLGVNFGHCGVLKTCCRIPPSYDRNALPADSFPLKAAAFAPDSKRVNSFTDFDNKPGFGKQDFPQAFVPSSDSDFSGAYPPVSSIGLQQSYPTCGSRNSYGARGRVANLNYPESGTDFAEFPWHVGIMKRLGPHESLYVCGGVLIASQWIATAAHCLKNLRPHELKVRLGEWDVHREDELYAHVEKLVTDVVIHPEFFPGNLNNDLALLRMDGPVDLNAPHIAAACLPEVAVNFIGQHCWVTGWGKDAFGPQGAYQHVLRKVDVPLLDPLDCQDRLRKTRLGLLFKLHTSFVCAGGEPGKDACTVCTFLSIEITSYEQTWRYQNYCSIRCKKGDSIYVEITDNEQLIVCTLAGRRWKSIGLRRSGRMEGGGPRVMGHRMWNSWRARCLCKYGEVPTMDRNCPR